MRHQDASGKPATMLAPTKTSSRTTIACPAATSMSASWSCRVTNPLSVAGTACLFGGMRIGCGNADSAPCSLRSDTRSIVPSVSAWMSRSIVSTRNCAARCARKKTSITTLTSVRTKAIVTEIRGTNSGALALSERTDLSTVIE